MDSTKTGKIISDLRKSKGWTQIELAEKLFVSDRTISKWESGAGFPEITQLPQLAKVFDVSIDYLLTGEGNEQKSLIERLEECAVNDDIVLFNKLKEQGLLNARDESGRNLTDYVKMHRSRQLFGLLLEEKEANNKQVVTQNQTQNSLNVSGFDYSGVNQNHAYRGATTAKKTKLIKPIIFIMLAAAFLGLITYFVRMISESVTLPIIGVVTSSFSLLDLLQSTNGTYVFMSILFLVSFLTQIINTIILLATPNVEETKYATVFKIISTSTFGALVVASAIFISAVNHYYPILLLAVNSVMLILSLVNLVANNDKKKSLYYIKHSRVVEILSISFLAVFLFLTTAIAVTVSSHVTNAANILTLISGLILFATLAYNIVSLVTKKVFSWGVALKGLSIFAAIAMCIIVSGAPKQIVVDSTTYEVYSPGIVFAVFGFLIGIVVINLVGMLRIGKKEQ